MESYDKWKHPHRKHREISELKFLFVCRQQNVHLSTDGDRFIESRRLDFREAVSYVHLLTGDLSLSTDIIAVHKKNLCRLLNSRLRIFHFFKKIFGPCSTNPLVEQRLQLTAGEPSSASRSAFSKVGSAVNSRAGSFPLRGREGVDGYDLGAHLTFGGDRDEGGELERAASSALASAGFPLSSSAGMARRW
ncbi:hypothetical protein Taro_038962 [Colocasia esculenta]|uniref:Uncharacterized protein n=1 Tax=Colocasia esculenta TaxID=4460 RepID=A0A843W830_COLES|nr:hypothetical protein [Colocasia esculenta]